MARTRKEQVKARVDVETKIRLRKIGRKTVGGESAVVRKAIERHLEEVGAAA